MRGDAVVDLGTRLAASGAPTLRTLLASGLIEEARSLAAEAAADIPLAGLSLVPVIPIPDKIICVGLNYRDHVAETGRTVTEKPALFARFPCSQVGHLQPLVKPAVSDRLRLRGRARRRDRQGWPPHRVRDDALDHVAGYACYNDGSVRDWQRHTSQFLAGKILCGSGRLWPVDGDTGRDSGPLEAHPRDAAERHRWCSTPRPT